MSEAAAAAIASGAALLSSLLTGWHAARLAAHGRREQARGELATAMAAYGYAVDRLQSEIGQLPPTPGRVTRATAAAVERLGTLDWSLGQISRHTLGRPAIRALDAYNAAANRLLLVAPTPVLDSMQNLNVLLEQVNNRGDHWNEAWREARNQYALAAREATASE